MTQRTITHNEANEKQEGSRSLHEISQSTVVYAIVGLRIVMGWILFQGGITKVLDPSWTAEGFLLNVIPEGNPLTSFFTSMAGVPAVDLLVQWGLTLTGLGLILGALVRWNAFWAAVMMIMFWAAALQGGLGEFLPLAHGWVVDDHILYAVLLFGLDALGTGRVLGVDKYLENTSFVQNNRWLKYLLG